MTLSSESLETGTGGSNSLRSTIQSLEFSTFRRIARSHRECARAFLLSRVSGVREGKSGKVVSLLKSSPRKDEPHRYRRHRLALSAADESTPPSQESVYHPTACWLDESKRLTESRITVALLQNRSGAACNQWKIHYLGNSLICLMNSSMGQVGSVWT